MQHFKKVLVCEKINIHDLSEIARACTYVRAGVCKSMSECVQANATLAVCGTVSYVVSNYMSQR